MIKRAAKRYVAWLIEPQVIFPLTATLLLVVLWAMTFGIVRVSHSAAVSAAMASSSELVDTYEAQVVRALGDIDQTLLLVKFWREREHTGRLAELESNGLLPANLLFEVTVVDANGSIVDSTRGQDHGSVADQDYFRAQRNRDSFFIADIPRGAADDAQLRFSRRINEKDGSFGGVVVVSVDAAYFVSAYDTSKMGARGVMGLLGPDGRFRVKRSGDSVTYGEAADYSSIVGPSDAERRVPITLNPGVDRIRQWVGARELYGFPLAVVVGLAEDEQLEAFQRNRATYVWRTAFASVLILVLSGLLGRLSWQLALSRLHERESALDHARRVEYLAYHDGLTGLPNRGMFSKLLNQSISDAHRYERTLAVAFLDLDRFKQINDSLGHEAGDQLLQDVSVRLRACVRESDTVARLGGDEFVVLLTGLENPAEAAAVAQKLLTIVARPFNLCGQEFRITVSIGISTYPQDGLDEQMLTKNADIAMYQAKALGKNKFQFYSESQDANSLQRISLEASLRAALRCDEFRLVYQAKREIGSGRVNGMEALLRWQHPLLGMLVPKDFIAVAEESGLIVSIGKWVLKSACLQNTAWQGRGIAPLSIAVNLTPRQFYDENLIEDVTSILAATGMSANLLELEITEGLLIHNVDATLRILTALKGLGVRIAIDDFGTCYSTLATLQRFPLDTIKIDRSLIQDIAASDEHSRLADAIIAMGKSIGVTVVAQGVETREQAEYLRTHACDELQGFYFERPLPAEESTKLLLGQAPEITYVGERLGLKAG
jgi:diguanylate cyclase (GGDEF)-like protein